MPTPHLSEILPSEKAFGSEFVDHYSKFLQRYEMKDYAGSLRDLRVLVQHAMEIVCEKKEIDLGDIQQRKIKNICDKMIKSKIIDEIMYNWFLAFTSVANLAAHKVYPSNKDLANYSLKERILITFLLGTHLVGEMERILVPPKTMKIKKGKLKINIKAKPVRRNQVFHETIEGLGRFNRK